MAEKQDFLQAVLENNQKFMDAYSKGDGEGIQALFTPECRFMPPNSPIHENNRNIPGFLKASKEKGLDKLTLTTVETWGPHGDMAVERLVVAFDNKEGKRVYDMKAIVLWRKVNGKWKIQADIWNADHTQPKV